MLSIVYGSNSYKIDADSIDSDYIKSLVELDPENKNIELSLFEDVFKCIVDDNKKDLFSLDKEYTFNGLAYFGCNKLLDEFLDHVKMDIYNKEMRVIQLGIESFYERHMDKLTWNPSYMRYGKSASWDFLSGNSAISEAFYEKYIDKVNWYSISGNSAISEAFYEKYIDKVDWESSIYWNQSISEAFFERHLDRIVNFDGLVYNKNVSGAFIEKHSDKISESSWYNLWSCSRLSEDFFIKI